MDLRLLLIAFIALTVFLDYLMLQLKRLLLAEFIVALVVGKKESWSCGLELSFRAWKERLS